MPGSYPHQSDVIGLGVLSHLYCLKDLMMILTVQSELRNSTLTRQLNCSGPCIFIYKMGIISSLLNFHGVRENSVRLCMTQAMWVMKHFTRVSTTWISSFSLYSGLVWL